MRSADLFKLSYGSLVRYRLRTGLMLLAMGIGVAAVVILTSLGEAARNYVTGEFKSLGSNLVIVIPGKSETSGGSPAMFVGETPRDLTLDDALSLLRSRNVKRVAPVVVGSADVSYGGREREIPVIGSTASLLHIRHWQLSQGRFLPEGDPRRAAAVAVIGGKVRQELFGAETALGKWIRVGERRFRVIGVLATEGRSIGVDVQELVIVPVASAQALYNSPGLFRILIEASSRDAIEYAKKFVTQTLKERHQGEEDVTVITQDAVLATFDRIFKALTLTVGGIASISLAVAGVLIMNVMLVAVSQRTAEIGLLKAVGAKRRQIISLFLAEATLLSLAGGALGLVMGHAGSALLGHVYPKLDFTPPLWAIIAAFGVAVVSGLVFGAMPARRAADMDAIEALSGR